jgi:hypothetical protein
VIAPQFKHFQKLRDLVEMRLPPGFPVKVDLPIFPTISARITFHDFEWKNGTGTEEDSTNYKCGPWYSYSEETNFYQKSVKY